MAELTSVTLTVTPVQLKVLLSGLDELPGKVSRIVYDELISQVKAQLNEASAPNGESK